MKLSSDEIAAVLRNHQQQPHNKLTATTTATSSCDVVFMIFLEPHNDGTSSGALDALSEQIIRTFSPGRTSLIHCELLVPPIPSAHGGKTNFATYIGRNAHWQNTGDGDDGLSYYLIENGARWRAVPVFAPNVARAARAAADANVGAHYSVGRYLTSARPMRRFAWLLSDNAGAPGHCATLSARVLKSSGANAALPRPSAWYCPSTLYAALNADLPLRLSGDDRARMRSVTGEDCATTIDMLLHSKLSYETVRGLGDAKCVEAVRALTLRACNTAQEATTSRLVQKQLAQVLLRWSLLRAEAPPSAPPSAPTEPSGAHHFPAPPQAPSVGH